jgi:hypothetical protein
MRPGRIVAIPRRRGSARLARAAWAAIISRTDTSYLPDLPDLQTHLDDLLRNRDRMYFIACLTVARQELGERTGPPSGRAA